MLGADDAEALGVYIAERMEYMATQRCAEEALLTAAQQPPQPGFTENSRELGHPLDHRSALIEQIIKEILPRGYRSGLRRQHQCLDDLSGQ